MEETSVPQLRGDLGLEQFLLLAKSAKGAAAAQLVHEATSSPGLYVFGELLEMETIQGLGGTEHAHFLRLLEVFAFGTYTDYKGVFTVVLALCLICDNLMCSQCVCAPSVVFSSTNQAEAPHHHFASC